MKRNSLNWAGLAVISAGMLAFTSCSKPDATEQVTTIETPDGDILVDTVTATATVTAIDAAKRDVTLMTPDGRKTTYKAGPEVVNFPQIKVGDQLKVTLTEEAAVFIGKGEPPSGMVGTTVALAPMGAKPGGVMVDTSQVTAKVTAVDAAKRKVTLQFPDGTTKTVKAGKKVDISTVQVGDDVTVVLAEGLAITVATP